MAPPEGVWLSVPRLVFPGMPNRARWTECIMPFPGRDSQISPPPSQSESAQETCIGNLNSKVFHREDCPNLPAEQNRVIFSSREEAVEEGYSPCGNCKP